MSDFTTRHSCFNFSISFIVATLGRSAELQELLLSLSNQRCANINFEIIIVDQNDNFLIDSIVNNFASALSIIHRKVGYRSTSRARNEGISLAKGRYIAFPDDDCVYYPDFLTVFESCLVASDFPPVVIARIFDRSSGKSLIKKFPAKDCRVSPHQFYSYASAIVLITSVKSIYFDEDFGPGGKYFSNEDPDYLLRLLLFSVVPGYYCSNLHVYHMEHSNELIPLDRVRRYSFGAGAMFRKHAGVYNVFYFTMILSLHFFRFLNSCIYFSSSYKNHWSALAFRLKGFICYKGPSKT